MGRSLVEIDRSLPEPLHRQVRRALEHAIAMGHLDSRLPLPSSRQLAAELGISRNTVNTAYQELLAEGFVESRPRRGLFVNAEMRQAASTELTAPGLGSRFPWASRLDALPSDGLPHVIKPARWHEYPYPFIAGQLDTKTFPTGPWLRALRDALAADNVHSSLQDSGSADDPLLIEMICRHILPSRGIEAQPAQVLVTLGSQEGLYLLSQTLLGAGTTVGVEDPGYLDARHIFRRAGATLIPVPVDAAGMAGHERLAGTDLIYLTPSHQHPTNVTLSAGRRHQILAMVRGHRTVVVEDDYDSEFRYQGSPSPALKALDQADQVVYLGTFSKFLAPGLRIGYLVAAAELVEVLRDRQRYMLRHPPGHLQRAMALMIQRGEYHRTVRRHRARLKTKWEEMCSAANEFLPWPTSPPPGGVSIWMTGPAALDSTRWAVLAERQGVLFEPGDVYFLDPGQQRNHLRLGFGAIPLRAIRPGLRILGALLPEALSPPPSSPP